MRKHRLFSLGVLAAFFAASIFITACGGLNDPQKPQNPANQDNTKPAAQQMVAADVFPKAPDGTTYSGYKITWTDAQGKEQTKTVTVDDIKNGIVLTGGVKEGTKPKVTPLVKNADGTETEKPDATQEVNPSSSTDWKLYIQAGIDELSKEKPDYDAALAKFKDAYNAEQNNTTKAYYAVVQLATISVKQETVDFMQNKMGFATYPATLNALVNLDWFKEYTYTFTWPDGTTHEHKYRLPELQPAADWYKDMFPALQIPAYLIEHSTSTKVDQLIDELYGILFGAEFTEASAVLNSLDATQPVTIDKQLVKVLHLSGEKAIFPEDSDVVLQKDQLLGVIGSLTVAKGGFEFIQSYSFNTDLSIFKWNWEKNDDVFNALGSYKQSKDPFNNGFMKGRSSSKMADAKADIVKGTDLLLAAYKSLTDSETLPSEVKAKVKEYTDFVQVIVQEIRDAIAGGRKANLFIGENNPMKGHLARYKYEQPNDPSQPGTSIPIPMTTFEIDMGKVFTYEYFKLSNLFEMNGSKPKIYPEDSAHSCSYMKFTFGKFLNDFVTMKWADGTEGLENWEIPLSGSAGEKIINFYK
jgi:putative lipoprotein